jgi:hypothetical protein
MSRKTAQSVTITKNYVTSENVKALPKRNLTPLSAKATALTKAIVKNIQSRRSFTSGPEFITAVTTSISTKFPSYTRNAVRIAVYRALENYFA